ncbi:hypothetical protein GF337_11405 [candidate division KSB1 bacterium]|nr:hypothetical protein [candidate division KSB1 bacterium]
MGRFLWILTACLLLLNCNTSRYKKAEASREKQMRTDAPYKRATVAHTKDSSGHEKTLSFPYLTIRFKQYDTEMEMIVDPLETNVQIDLQRTPESSLDISPDSTKDDSSETDFFDESEPESPVVDKNLTDDILSDLNRAQSYFYEGDYSNAMREVKKSIKKKPTASAYALGGSIFYMNGETDRAIDAWETALEINPAMKEVENILRQVKK